MDYDYRNRSSSAYDSQVPMHRSSTSSSATPPSHSMYGTSLYPRVSQPPHTVVPPIGRHHSTSSSFHQPSSSPSSGLSIRVMLKPEYRITPPPQLTPQMGEIPRSNFQFNFDLERKILAEAEKETQNWSRLGLENLPSKPLESASSLGSTGGDPLVSKYIAMGLNRDAVPLAVANYGDNPTKVQEFVNGFSLLREMGFSSNNVAEALLTCDNDRDKALAHCLSGS